jgi:hypothetical protein
MPQWLIIPLTLTPSAVIMIFLYFIRWKYVLPLRRRILENVADPIEGLLASDSLTAPQVLKTLDKIDQYLTNSGLTTHCSRFIKALTEQRRKLNDNSDNLHPDLVYEVQTALFYQDALQAPISNLLNSIPFGAYLIRAVFPVLAGWLVMMIMGLISASLFVIGLSYP